jgi:hypothetical protein
MDVWEKTKLFEKLTRLQWLLVIGVTVPCASVLGLSYLCYQYNQHTLASCKRNEVGIVDLHKMLSRPPKRMQNVSTQTLTLEDKETDAREIDTRIPEEQKQQEKQEQPLKPSYSNELLKEYHIIYEN